MGQILAFAPLPYPAETAGLAPAERAVLLALRLWVAAFRYGADPGPDLLAAMATHGAPPDAALSVDALLAIAARTARRPLDLRCPACLELSVDEARLLHAATLAQRGEGTTAEEALRALLTDAGACFALGPLEGLGELFAATGLRLRPRRPPGAVDRDAPDGIEAWAPPLGPQH